MKKFDSSLFLRFNGIPSQITPSLEESFFFLNALGEWRQNGASGFYAVEDICVEIHDLIFRILNTNDSDDGNFIPPYYLSAAGISSDVKMSKSSFENRLNALAKKGPSIVSLSNKEMYLHDLQKLVTGLQSCNEEIEFLLGEFYERLNTYSSDNSHTDGIFWSKDADVVNMILAINFIYVRMYSSLDYTVKLLYEVQNFQFDYSSYVTLKSNGLLFGDKKKIKLVDASDTVFENCDLISEIETIRHFIIHDSFLDDLPRVYVDYKEGIEVEKFILKPDMTSGRLDKYKNRRLFYGGENKWNLSLPNTLEEFRRRQVKTLKFAATELRQILT